MGRLKAVCFREVERRWVPARLSKHLTELLEFSLLKFFFVMYQILLGEPCSTKVVPLGPELPSEVPSV